MAGPAQAEPRQSAAKAAALLLALYQAAHRLSHAEFPGAALELLRHVIAFDCARWGCSHPGGLDLVFHDDLAHLSSANTSLQFDRHQLLIGGSDSGGGLVQAIALYRMPEHPVFEPGERRRGQFLAPHWIEALKINRILQLEQFRAPLKAGSSGVAIADRHGWVHHSDAGFDNLLLSEWEQYLDHRLPAQLLHGLQQAAEPRYLGSRLVIDWMAGHGVYFLRARNRLPVDNLSARELAIAREIAQGLTHKEIALKLGIAPSTVRNHLSKIHTRVRSRNNAELAGSLRSAGY